MAPQASLPEPVFVQEHGEWLVECPLCAELVFGESPELTLEAGATHVDLVHSVNSSPDSDLRGEELLSRIATPRTHEWEWAVGAVHHYFESGAYTGGMFERLQESDSDRITATDLVAVSMLGVPVPPRGALDILGRLAAPIDAALARIPATPISNVERSVLEPGSGAYDLWSSLCSIRGMGPTLTSKLMARKRPHLIPVWDSRIKYRVPELKDHQWGWWWSWWQEKSHVEGVAAMKAEADSVDDISLLRVLDVALWRYDVSLRPVLRSRGRGPWESSS